MEICIIRHGETDWNKEKRLQGRENIPLNEEGINQIKNTIEYLKKYKWDIIITSPLSRAKQSAEL
jgi:broad specificity phosphatase PhoE